MFKFLIIFILFNYSILAFADSVLFKKDTYLLKDSKKDTETKILIKKDSECDLDERKGMFYKVSCPEGDGFIYFTAATRKMSSSGLAETLKKVAIEARDNAANGVGENTRSRTAVMGVRGLSESNELSQISNMKADLKTVYQMEDRVVDENRINLLENLVHEEIENLSK